MNKKIMSITTAVGISTLMVLSSVGGVTKAWASNNTSVNDYFNNLEESGAKIEINDAVRDRGLVKIVYTMTFKEGVPDSIKNKESFGNEDSEGMKSTIHTLANTMKKIAKEKNLEYCLEMDGDALMWVATPLSVDKDFEPVLYDYFRAQHESGRQKIEGFDIKANGISITNKDLKGEESADIGIWYYTFKDLEVTENTIKKQVIINLNESKGKKDIPIEIGYTDIKKNNGGIISGQWKLEHLIKGEDESAQVEKKDLNVDYKVSNGQEVKFNQYSYNSDRMLKLYATHNNIPQDWELDRLVRLEGKDNLGNKVIMYPSYPNYDSNSTKLEAEYGLYSGPGEVGIEQLDPNATSVTLNLYEQESDWVNNIFKWNKVGEEFTINLK